MGDTSRDDVGWGTGEVSVAVGGLAEAGDGMGGTTPFFHASKVFLRGLRRRSFAPAPTLAATTPMSAGVAVVSFLPNGERAVQPWRREGAVCDRGMA